MVKVKKIVSMLLALILAFPFSITALAGDISQDISTTTNQPRVIIENTNQKIPDYIIKDLIKDNPDAGQITITEFSSMSQTNNSNNMVITPMYVNYYSDVVKVTTASNVLAKDSFVTSVARGQTQTLSNTWSGTLSCTISGKIDYASLGITGSLTKTYTKTDVFNGPPESSNYNCREFRVKFYQNQGTYTDKYHTDFSGSVVVIPESGNWTEPSYYLAYSIDKNVN